MPATVTAANNTVQSERPQSALPMWMDTDMKKLAIIFTLLLLTAPAWAQSCTAASCAAASCNESDILAALPSSGNGNATVTVSVPACSGGTSWTTGLAYTLPSAVTQLNIVGAGTPNAGSSATGPASNCNQTYLLDNAGSTNAMWGIQLTYPQIVEIGCMNLDPATTSTSLTSPIQVAGTCTSSGCPQVRIHNITFGAKNQWTESGNGSPADWLIRTDNLFGVLDHNSIPSGSNVELFNANLSAYLGTGGYGDNSWAQPDSFGGANALYAEYNSIYIGGQALNDCDNNPQNGGIGGCRIAVRYNTITANGAFSVAYVHGLDTDGRPQGGRQIEAYRNTVTCTYSGGCNGGMATFRSGTGYVWGNTMAVSGGGFYNNVADIVVYRTVYGNTQWGACGGSSAYDTNDGTVYVSGTVSSASGGGSGLMPVVVTDTSKSWTANQWAPNGAPYTFHDVTQGFWIEIASNTSNALTTQSLIPEGEYVVNGGDSYQILRSTACADQAGRGAGNYVSGSTPSSSAALNQTLDPIYEFMDTASAVLHGNISTDTGRTIANRDWYTDNSAGEQSSATSPFTGASGVGWGITANRPTNCTTGVAYWDVTNSWLDKCTATNTWSNDVYAAYTTPHPLDSTSTTPPGIAVGPCPAGA